MDTPNYGKQINRWQDALKGDISKRRQHTLRGNIQEAKVGRWGQKTKKMANAPAPKDSLYNTEVGLANQTYGNAMIGAGLKESSTLRDFGLNDEYSATGAQYNPYSRASALQSSYQRDQRTTINSYAAQGQLYSGARENAQAHDNRAYLSDLNSLETGQTEALAAIQGDKLAAEEARQKAILEATQANGERWLENRPTEAAPPPKFVKQFKGDLKDKLESLRGKKADAKNKYMKKKLKKKIKATKKDLKSIPQQYAE